MRTKDIKLNFNPEKETIVSAIKRLANKVLPSGSSITLFGSQARGDSNAESDWDLLILISSDNLSNSMKGEVAYPFVELGWQVDAEINPIVHSYREWDSRRHLQLYHNIVNDGIKIWD